MVPLNGSKDNMLTYPFAGVLGVSLLFARFIQALNHSVYRSGPLEGQGIKMAWGAKSLTKSSGLTPRQIASLSSFSSQPEIFAPKAYPTIWDFFPLTLTSQYPLTKGVVMQDPQDQQANELAATACDSCRGASPENLVDLPTKRSDWRVVWEQAAAAYQDLLDDDDVSKEDNLTNFKMALNWYTSPNTADSENMTFSYNSINKTRAGVAGLPDSNLGSITAVRREAPARGTVVCSTFYLEGLTSMDRTKGQEIFSVIPTHFQDLSVQCGCDLMSVANGLYGSPFRGGWKVVMRGLKESWRFRVESPGSAC